MVHLNGYIQLSSQAFAALGLQNVAYLKPVQREGKAVIAVHAADGTELALAETRELAAAFVRQNDLEPLSAH
ncbi:MAG TPA: DUF1150 family protein [Alphaproteobacteria bacterium]|nr:DUF1150 family protein [Alphaproteobacteria bacterium]